MNRVFVVIWSNETPSTLLAQAYIFTDVSPKRVEITKRLPGELLTDREVKLEAPAGGFSFKGTLRGTGREEVDVFDLEE